MITYQIRKVMGDLDKVADAWNAKITKKADTGETEINEEQEKLLVASETQIESSSRILSESTILVNRPRCQGPPGIFESPR